MRLTDFLREVGPPVGYYPGLTRITGGVKETLFLCQLLYWTDREADPEGWVHKTQEEIAEETGLSRREQESARRSLKELGFLEEKREGCPARLLYRVNLDALNAAWEKAKGGE
ncbi:hypothetical protein [Ammonifex thiophilus]|uniref:Helix-turn-helix domain-containing protein n=1 Tax=Ammonifex thiophilus TaxID=444093 RepID=A0A3D8P6P1_9THEO|nr:hypothetical protein [Ammonifex thiophilus]RDV83898.1 hypothetical protein DXX99_03425 [Ammonifex thiophilus]